MADVTAVGAGPMVSNQDLSVNLTPTLPVGVTAGDYLVAVIAIRGSAADASNVVATGWTNIGVQAFTTAVTLLVMGKFAGASESNPTFSVSGLFSINGWGVALAAFRDVNSTTPADATAVGSQASSSLYSPTGITTANDGAMVLSAVATSDDNALILNTANGFTGLMTGASYDSTDGNDFSIGLAYKAAPTAGAYTCPTWEHSVNFSDDAAALTLALSPSVPGETVTPTDVALAIEIPSPSVVTADGLDVPTLRGPLGGHHIAQSGIYRI